MKSIIDGKRYNTDTAEQVFYFQNMADYNNLDYYQDTLYQTKSGAFFIERSPSVRQGGRCELEAMTHDEAYEFLEGHSSEDDAFEAIEKLFSDRIKDA